MSSERQYFGTDGIRGRVGVPPITAEFALKLGWAVGQVVAHEGQGHVVMGQDPRLSGPLLVAALEAGIMASGLTVYSLGIMPTPAVAYLTRAVGAQLGIVVSASHNLYSDNGIKFFSAQGRKLPDVIENQIESYLSRPMSTVEPHRVGKRDNLMDAAQRYIQFCKDTFLKPYDLRGMKIVIDCANGATYHVAPAIFQELGADVILIHHQPDGININEQCGSTHPASLQAAVLDHQAAIGIAFDGDGDRVIFVDHQGELVDGDELLYIIALFYQQQGILQGGVVGTQMSNLGLEQAFKRLAIPFVRSRVGDRYVMDELQQKQWVLGGESSGHIICLDKTSTGDGIISALQLLSYLCMTNQSLHDLKKGMVKCAQVLLNIPVPQGGKVVYDPRVEAALKRAEKRLAEQGRILLRPSGTEPVIRVMVEGDDPALIEEVADMMSQVVIDVSNTVKM